MFIQISAVRMEGEREGGGDVFTNYVLTDFCSEDGGREGGREEGMS